MKYSVRELSERLKRGEISSYELTREYLERIKRENSRIGAFISVCEDSALEHAAKIDGQRKSAQPLSPLAGIPFGAKDNICARGTLTTCGSAMLESFCSPYDATALARLRAEGAVLLGKLNMDEFGMGNSTLTSHFGVTRNPSDTSRVAGGSSGGSAAAVAARMLPFALGSDTGGSVRQPAAYCGCVGLLPTYGAVSRYGLVAFASSLDQIGIIGGCAQDCGEVLRAISGRDAFDATAREARFENTAEGDLTVGFCTELSQLADGAVRERTEAAARALRESGVRVIEVKMPDAYMAVAAYYVISCAEASSNLARFDGVRYGHRASGATGVDELMELSRTQGFGDEVKRRIMLGTAFLSTRGRQTYYARALEARRQIARELGEVLGKCDAILLPTAMSIAPKIEDAARSTPLEEYKKDAFCVYANLAHLPAISVPFGTADGCPVGVQLVGRAFGEHTLVDLAQMLERAQEKAGGRTDE